MTTYNAQNANIQVFVRRQSGTLLSRMGHDIKLRVSRFQIDADFAHGQVSAHIDAASLEPVDAITWDDKQETGALNEGDRHEIKQKLNNDVLEVERYPTIEFEASSVESTDTGWHVVGSLKLHGQAHEVEFDVVGESGRARVETVVDHTDYGIEPYSAMLGSLKVAPELYVRVETPLDDD